MDWKKIANSLDAVVTRGTIHHWGHIPQVALELRRGLKCDGFWFATMEYIANTPKALLQNLKTHPFFMPYGTYEWPYPASAYVDLIESVGFKLIDVAPQFYRQNQLVGSRPPVPSNVVFPDFDIEIEAGDNVKRFWSEVDHFRWQKNGMRLYTFPQAFVFQRVEIDDL